MSADELVTVMERIDKHLASITKRLDHIELLLIGMVSLLAVIALAVTS